MCPIISRYHTINKLARNQLPWYLLLYILYMRFQSWSIRGIFPRIVVAQCSSWHFAIDKVGSTGKCSMLPIWGTLSEVVFTNAVTVSYNRIMRNRSLGVCRFCPPNRQSSLVFFWQDEHENCTQVRDDLQNEVKINHGHYSTSTPLRFFCALYYISKYRWYGIWEVSRA